MSDQITPTVESPQLMASRGAASNPNFLKFLVQVLRQGTRNPDPAEFGAFDQSNAPPTAFEQMKQGIQRRNEYLK